MQGHCWAYVYTVQNTRVSKKVDGGGSRPDNIFQEFYLLGYNAV